LNPKAAKAGGSTPLPSAMDKCSYCTKPCGNSWCITRIKKMAEEKYTNLGFANGWSEYNYDHPTTKACRKLGHKQEGVTIGNCLMQYKCTTCKYVYKVDSSD